MMEILSLLELEIRVWTEPAVVQGMMWLSVTFVSSFLIIIMLLMFDVKSMVGGRQGPQGQRLVFA